MKWYPIADVSAIPKKEGRRVDCGDFEIALFNLGSEYVALENKCPHKGGPLADGIIAGKAVFCPLHNLKISLENGCALNGGEGQVKTYPTRVFGERVCIAFEEGKYHPKACQEGLAVERQNLMDVN
ncbi:MAG: nitrite reductase small subunit NirD [Candidatus Omnitrophica bacterium]|nr:nitrite reductase small subunit NirD [Candidatus Omnitrophota bacterium]